MSGLLVATNNGDPWQGVAYNGTNGDGTTAYPGRQVGNPMGRSDVGVTTPIILPSRRMKNIRDGIQDYEIINVLNNNGQSAAVTAAYNSFMVTLNGNTGLNSGNWSFNNTESAIGPFTSDLPDARATLGTTMHHLTYSAVLAPPPTLTGTLQ